MILIGKIAEKRTVLGADGARQEFLEQEYHANELLKQLMLTAPYSGEHIGKYELLDNAYRASGGFETGEYLIPHPSELVTKYKRRQQLSYFLNYVRPVVDSLVNPVFKTEPVREGGSSTYHVFEKDVDGNNTTLTHFMKKAAIRAKLHGVEFIVVDMERVEDNIITKKDIMDRRLYPYLYLVSPSQLDNWYMDKLGRLVSITYHVDNNIVQSDGTIKKVTEQWTWTNDLCIKQVEDKEERFENPIGVIPIIPVYGTRNDSKDLVPQSDIYSIARANFALYNACSELRERNRNQGFSILTYPLAEDDDFDANEDNPISVGTADTLIYKNGGQSPEFITPPPDSSNMISNEIKMIIEEIYRMAKLRMLSNEKSQYNVSGTARKWENLQLFQSISEFAQELKDAEEKIAFVFGKYMGEDNSEVTIVYNNEFGIPDPSATLANAVTSLQMDVSPLFNEEVKKLVIRAVLDGVDDNTINLVLKDLDNNPNKGNPVTLEQVSVVQPTSGG